MLTLSKCSHGMFAWFRDWHFLFVTCLTKETYRPNSTVPTGNRLLLAAATCIWFLFYFPLSLPPSCPSLSLYFDMHIVLADFYHLTRWCWEAGDVESGQPGTIGMDPALGYREILTKQAEWGVGWMTFHTGMLLKKKEGVTQSYFGTTGIDGDLEIRLT